MSAAATISIRTMTPADIPGGLALCRAARWNQTERDWRYFLTTAPDGALVAVENGEVIGSVATVPYGPFTWISMVLVDPASRGRGVGTTMLRRGLALVPEHVTARLDATPAGEQLYRKLGFADEYALARWFVDAERIRARGAPAARPLASADWAAVLEMDQRAFGASRAELLTVLAEGAPEYAWVLPRKNGGLRGYMLGRRGHVRDQLGPIVAEEDDAAHLLIESCLAAHGNRSVFMDVPDRQTIFRSVLSSAGSTVERPFLRMYRGELVSPGRPSLVYAIAGPELG